MTTDYIVIEPSLFYELKDSVHNEKITQRIASLLDSYKCFKEAPQAIPMQSYHFPAKFPNRPHCNSHHQSKTRYDHAVKRKSAVPVIVRRPKQLTVEREITAMLNKITKGNYNKLSKTITKLTLSSDEGLGVILTQLFIKCQRQVCFMTLYLSLLEDIHRAAPVEMKSTISDFVSEHVTRVCAEAGHDTFSLQSANYDEFCGCLARKGEIIGNHKTVLQIMGAYPHMIRKDSQLDAYFEDIFKHTCDVGESVAMPRNNDLHELLLEMLVDFVKLNDVWKARIASYFSDKNKMQLFSHKAKFQVMDIIK
jgi:hypothetical protein